MQALDVKQKVAFRWARMSERESEKRANSLWHDFSATNLATTWLTSPFFFRFTFCSWFFCLQFTWQYDVQLGLRLSLGHNTQFNSAQCCTWNGCWNCYRLRNCTIKLWISEANWCDSRWPRKESHWISLEETSTIIILILTKNYNKKKQFTKIFARHLIYVAQQLQFIVIPSLKSIWEVSSRKQKCLCFFLWINWEKIEWMFHYDALSGLLLPFQGLSASLPIPIQNDAFVHFFFLMYGKKTTF